MLVPVVPVLLVLLVLFAIALSSHGIRATGSLVVLFFCTSFSVAAQTAVLTQHNDNSRDGQNTTETVLTTSNVNVTHFGKLFSLPVNGQVYAQPLYVPHVTINGVVHNVLIVATENDSVYAFDADSNTGANAAPLWHASLVDAAHGAGPGETALNSASTIKCTDTQPLIGITSTPVIDASTNTIYVEAKSTNGTTYVHRLHSLDLFTGNEKSPGPVVIRATVNGTGDGSVSGKLVFDSTNMALHQQSRAGLLLVNGTIYMGFASHCDIRPYHGWLFAYDAATLTQKSVYVSTPNGSDAGFWMSGAGIAADSSGSIYISTGNGTFDSTNTPPTETGDTILKFGTTNQILKILDYFTPFDQASLNASDLDLGSGGVVLLPDQSGAHIRQLITAGKGGRIYVVDRDQMTANNLHYCSGCTSDNEIIEETSANAVGKMFAASAYWNGNIYFWGLGDVLKQIPITNGLPDFTHMSTNSLHLAFPGATPSISSNGTLAGTAIVWAIDSSQYGSPGPGPGPSVLHAFDATNISHELWNSTQAPGNRDQAGNAVKFAVPTISNGKVYIGTSTEVDVYGLLTVTPATATPSITPTSESVSSPVTVTMSDATSGATIYYTLDGSAPSPVHGTVYTNAFTVNSSTTVRAMAASAGNTNSLIATEIYTIQSNPASSINFSSGMSASGMTLSGSAKMSGTRLRLTDGAKDEAGSAFFTTPVNVQSFTTDFSFQLTSANADGFTFAIHGGSTPAALGPNGGGLGYGPASPSGTRGIPLSVAVKFDLYNNAGEGNDSTGIYTDGASPTTPFVNLSSTGINLHSGDIFQVHLSYSGTTLAMTISDTTTENSFSTTFTNINIPSIVGSSNAYAGFTAGTGGLTATQEILSWTYASGSSSSPQPPSITAQPSSQTVAVGQTATFSVTATGTAPLSYQWQKSGTNISGANSSSYTTPATTSADNGSTFDVIVTNSAGSATSNSATLTVTSANSTVNFGNGFTSTAGLQLNGSATWNQSASRLRLTSGGFSQRGSFFFTTPVNVQSFTNDFSFQLSNPKADGFTFTIQNVGPNALGPVGGGLAYGGTSSNGTAAITSSIAVKFDLYNNAGEGIDSTGEYANGASPTVPAIDLTASGVNLHSGDVMNVHMTYDGTTLTMTITDSTAGKTFVTSWNVNIPATVGSNNAYVGFTGATGGLTSTQEILSWSYTGGSSK